MAGRELRMGRFDEEQRAGKAESSAASAEEFNPTLGERSEAVGAIEDGNDAVSVGLALDPSTTNSEEVEIDAAMGLNHDDRSEFLQFLSSIQVSFAAAVSHDMDVSEVYSAPRATEAARKMGLMPGWPLDICTVDEEGHAWDFTNAKMRNKVARKVIEDKPLFRIGSPPCTDWSNIMDLNWHRMSEEEVDRRKEEAKTRLEVSNFTRSSRWVGAISSMSIRTVLRRGTMRRFATFAGARASELHVLTSACTV